MKKQELERGKTVRGEQSFGETVTIGPAIGEPEDFRGRE
jgi:hypothetical protein